MYSINFISLFKSNKIYVCGERSKHVMFLRIKKRKGNPQIPKNFPLNILLPLPPSPKLNLKSNTTLNFRKRGGVGD
jgi:hypothetical protein